MVGVILGFVGALVAAVVAIGIVFVLGMRAKSPLVQGAVIALGKHGFNRIGLRTAGQAGASTARIHHLGRTSGRMYETPVGAVATDDGFLISLPYGLRSQWLRNVLASGSARLDHDGHSYEVGEPEMIPLKTVEMMFGSGDQTMHRLFDVREVLRLRRTDADAATDEAAVIRSSDIASAA